MIRHVIFDCDGVLVDTESTAADIMVAKLNALGISITKEYYLSNWTGSTFSAIFRHYLDSYNHHYIPTLIDHCEVAVYDKLNVIIGMPELVKSISLNKTVVSNSYVWQVEKALRLAELTDFFEHIVSSEMVANPKPHPDVYHHALKMNGLQPQDCIVIEDSKSGTKSALDAGLKVIGFCGASHILPGHSEALLAMGATAIANSPAELKTILGSFIK